MIAGRKELIDEVRNYPILFDPLHEYYKNPRKKEKVWKEVAMKLNAKSGTIRKKWQGLRDTYMRYLRKEQRNKEQNKINFKKWEWADHMEIFKPYFFAAKNSTTNCGEFWNMNDDTNFGYAETVYNDDDSQVELIEDDSNQAAEENVKFEETIVSQISSSSVDIVTTSKSGPTAIVDSANSSNSTSTAKRKRTNSLEENNLRSTAAAETLISFLNNKNNHEIDEIDLLFLAHAQTLKKFTKRRQAITKMKIAQVMMEQELENIDE